LEEKGKGVGKEGKWRGKRWKRKGGEGRGMKGKGQGLPLPPPNGKPGSATDGCPD